MRIINQSDTNEVSDKSNFQLAIDTQNLQSKEERARAALESSSYRESFDRISNCQESQNFENWNLEMENIFSLVCKLNESEKQKSSSF